MKAFVYTAVKTYSEKFKELDGHITTSFTKIDSSTPKITLQDVNSFCVISSIKYLPHGNVTVAVINSLEILEVHAQKMSMGFNYDYDFIPHITLCRGDSSDKYDYLIGEQVKLKNEYAGFIVDEN